ncbi:MAG: hypothetical protein ACR2PF_21145, partial [Rhizobiaceae bacterium]
MLIKNASAQSPAAGSLQSPITSNFGGLVRTEGTLPLGDLPTTSTDAEKGAFGEGSDLDSQSAGVHEVLPEPGDNDQSFETLEPLTPVTYSFPLETGLENQRPKFSASTADAFQFDTRKEFSGQSDKTKVTTPPEPNALMRDVGDALP